MGITLLAIQPPFSAVLIQLAVIGVLLYTLIILFRDNRLLFYCLFCATLAHGAIGGVLWGVSYFQSDDPEMIRINIAAIKPMVKQVAPQKPVVLPKTLDLPLGRPDGDRKVKAMPKGSNLKDKSTGGGGKPGDGKPTHVGRTLYDQMLDDGFMPVDPGLTDLTGSASEIGANDIRGIGTGRGGGGDFGVPDGVDGGGIPAGFTTGKKDGRVYFIRLKHGTGAWNKYADGTKRLLAFLNTYFPCQSDTWPMTATELNDKYLKKGAQPSFLYLYCDDTFKLSQSEVTILRDYLNNGGFLFMDSAPDPAARSKVTTELQRVLPGERLADIARSHKINAFLFRLEHPGIGLNMLTMRNYGITRSGRLAVFYSMGNFALFYNDNPPDATFTYGLAQYQMGANVMLYAITRGDDSDISKRKGADARITESVVDHLTRLTSGGGPPSTAPGGPDESVKVKPPTTGEEPLPGSDEVPEVPDEIKLLN